MTELRRPELLDPKRHDRSRFDCGDDSLNEWLRRFSGHSRRAHTAATWVIAGLFSHVYKDRAGPNVLALLGNTLGNMSDDFGFLERLLASGTWPGDLLLLEVRGHVDEEAGQAPGMGEETKKRLNFGSLEILGASYEEHRDLITVRREHSRSVIPNTVTTVTRCERVRDVRVCYVHEYSESDLDDVVADIGYTIVKKFHRGVRGADEERVVLLYLLQEP